MSNVSKTCSSFVSKAQIEFRVIAVVICTYNNTCYNTSGSFVSLSVRELVQSCSDSCKSTALTVTSTKG